MTMDTDRNVLVVVLALQADLIDISRFVKAFVARFDVFGPCSERTVITEKRSLRILESPRLTTLSCGQ
jgi:hypothetical protein